MYGNPQKRTAADVQGLRREGGRWLKERREAAGLSQRQLAERVGADYYTFISQLETGRGRIPPDRYVAWAKALGIDSRAFVRAVMRFYDPITYDILFGAANDAGAPPGTGSVGTGSLGTGSLAGVVSFADDVAK